MDKIITLETLANDFPRSDPSRNYAISGYIPMDYFVANEATIRRAIRRTSNCDPNPKAFFRVRYRGPRRGHAAKKADCRREDAQAVLIFPSLKYWTYKYD